MPRPRRCSALPLRAAATFSASPASTLPDITAMTRDLRDASENLRRISESLERDPSVLLYGRADQKRGPGE